MGSNNINIDEDTARLVTKTYSLINTLKHLSVSDEFLTLNEFLNSCQSLNTKLNHTISAENAADFLKGLSNCIAYLERLLEVEKSSPCIVHVHSIMEPPLTAILENLQLIRNRVETR